MAKENNSKYCYDNGVLMNNFEIKNIDLLRKVERNITTYKIAQIECGKDILEGDFGLNGYLKLHEFLFKDIYGLFAGQLRDEFIYKTNEPFFPGKTPFCMPAFIYEQLRYVLNDMHKKMHRIQSRDDLLQWLSYYYGELNMIHPFREGNGRTLRTFLKLYVDEICKKIPLNVEICYSKWSEEDQNNMVRATILSNNTGNIESIYHLFDKILIEKEKVKTR